MDRSSENSLTSQLLEAIGSWLTLRLRLLSILILASVLVYFSAQLLMGKNVDSNLFSLCLNYCLVIGNSFSSLVIFIASTEREFISVERVSHYFSNETENLMYKIKASIE